MRIVTLALVAALIFGFGVTAQPNDYWFDHATAAPCRVAAHTPGCTLR